MLALGRSLTCQCTQALKGYGGEGWFLQQCHRGRIETVMAFGSGPACLLTRQQHSAALVLTSQAGREVNSW